MTNTTAVCVLSAALIGGCRASGPPPRTEDPVLTPLLWESRPLVLFAPATADPTLCAALDAVETGLARFAERDMTLVTALPDEVRLGARRRGARAAAELRERFDIDPAAFCAILVGKDGGEKARADRLDDLEAWFALIDAMPMRRAEMRRVAERRDETPSETPSESPSEELGVR